jgi:DNA-binding winged helix-turn-helix (wHTH) protein
MLRPEGSDGEASLVEALWLRAWMQMSNTRYHFGEFTLDSSLGSLSHGAEEVVLSPESFAVLEYLVRHPCRLVTEEELALATCGDASPSEDWPARCVGELRAALGPDGEAFIKTISRPGYALDVDVTATHATATVSPAVAGELAAPRRRQARDFIQQNLVWWLALPASLLAVISAVLTLRYLLAFLFASGFVLSFGAAPALA